MTGTAKKLWEKRNRPTGPFVWITREMLESEAWCSLSLAARRVIDRVMIEHMLHAGTENGNLIVTYRDFRKCGIRGSSIKPAISEAGERGLLITIAKGRRFSACRLSLFSGRFESRSRLLALIGT